MSVVDIQEYKSSGIEAKRCAERAAIYEKVHNELNDIYLHLMLTKNGLHPDDLSELFKAKEAYKHKADAEWVEKVKLERGSI